MGKNDLKKAKVISTSREGKRTVALVECPTCKKRYSTRLCYIKSKNFIVECLECSRKGKNVKHGCCGTNLYRVWQQMRERCRNKKNKAYKHYGGRGICVSSKWGDFLAFKDWAEQNGYKNGLTIDRVDNDGGYTPDNCRWADRFVQGKNTKKLRSTNKTGYRGVCFHKKAKKYMAEIMNNGVKTYLGLYETSLLAAIAYDEFIIKNNLCNTKNGVVND